MIDDLRHLPQPDAFSLDLSPAEFAVILACAVAFGFLIA